MFNRVKSFFPKSFKIRVRKFLQMLELAPFRFHQSKSNSGQFIIVTGADSSHFKSLCQLLNSVERFEPNVKIIAFDLGLLSTQTSYLKDNFPNVELRVFDYALYPSYFNIKVNAGEYAWKPVILCDVLYEFKCRVCWMDAGNLIVGQLIWIKTITDKIGVYSPHSSGSVNNWTHPKTLEYLKAPTSVLDKPNLNGACVSVDYDNAVARNLIYQWKKCALDKDCIAPIGSSRLNHRQDQAVLTVLAYMSGLAKKIPSGAYGFKIHQDID